MQKINEDYLDYGETNQPYKKKDKLDDRKFGLDDNTDEDFKSQIGKYYGETLPERQQLLLSKYFMLLAALEYNNSSYQKQQKILDDLVDLTIEKVDETDLLNPIDDKAVNAAAADAEL